MVESSNLDTDLLKDINEVNLSYLMLAQRLLQEDLESGMYRLGFDIDTAQTILNLSPAQIVKVSGTNSLLCSFRLRDSQLLKLLSQGEIDSVIQKAHSTILLAKNQLTKA